jgi:hypothetical protein
MMNNSYPDVLRLRVIAEAGELVEYISSNESLHKIDQQHAKMYTEWEYNLFVIHRQVEPDYEPEFTSIRVEIVGFEDEPLSVKVDDMAAPVWYYENNVVELRVDSFAKIQVATPIGHSDETIVSRPPEL